MVAGMQRRAEQRRCYFCGARADRGAIAESTLWNLSVPVYEDRSFRSEEHQSQSIGLSGVDPFAGEVAYSRMGVEEGWA
jgi:hypothetical protein